MATPGTPGVEAEKTTSRRPKGKNAFKMLSTDCSIIYVYVLQVKDFFVV